MQRADPQVAMQVLLDAGDVLAGCPGYRFKATAAELVAHQAIAHRAYPEVAFAVLPQGTGQEDTAIDASFHGRIGDERRLKLSMPQ